MRVLVCLALLMPGGAFADTIMATSRVTAVTIYPQGAQVTREAVFTAPAGAHEVVIMDLPGETEPGLLRVASDDVDLGSFALRSDRLPPRGDASSPEMAAAEEAVKAAKVALQEAEARVAGINAEVEAQEAQIAFLTGVKLNDGAATAEGIVDRVADDRNQGSGGPDGGAGGEEPGCRVPKKRSARPHRTCPTPRRRWRRCRSGPKTMRRWRSA